MASKLQEYRRMSEEAQRQLTGQSGTLAVLPENSIAVV